MKKNILNILKTVGATFVFILIFASCDTWIDTDLNTDPDAPADVPMNLMLPAIQQSMGYNLVGNDMARTTSIWMQQYDGVDRQSLTQSKYQLLPADVNNLWTTFYTEMLMNSMVIIDKAENTEGKESPHNAGVAKVLVATTLGITTDVFGSMPFSDAFKGNESVLEAMFDTQEQIYATINSYLDVAISDLGSATNAVDVEGDVIYGGDVAMWEKAAYSIKARHALQLSALNGNSAYEAALTAAANGFESIADDYEVPFESDNKNPIFQFMEQRTDIRMGATFVDMMKATDDPRIPFYVAADEDGEYTGCVIGSENSSASYPGDYVAAADASTIMMSYVELKFIEAEAHFVLGHSADADLAFADAVKASVLKVTGEAADSTWLADNVTELTLSLELIMEQKYIACFGTNQAYADYRRTGLPNIPLHPDALIASIPTRFPYAQDEITYNGSNVPSVSISDKLWWDN